MNNVQLIIVIIVMSLSALNWLFNRLAEQRERQRIQAERERRALERLRTGREPDSGEAPPLPAGPSDMPGQGTLAERRQAQLRELRRRAREVTMFPAAGPSVSPPVAAGPPVPRVRVAGERRGAPARPGRPGGAKGDRVVRPRPGPQTEQRPARPRGQTAPPTLVILGPAPMPAPVVAVEPARPPDRSATRVIPLAPLSERRFTPRRPARSAIQQAFLLKELMEPPLALRGQPGAQRGG